MSNIELKQSNADEVAHLFEVIKKYKVNCTLEIKRERPPHFYNTYHGTIDDFDLSDESDIYISFGEAEMYFESSHFFKYVSDSCINIAITSQDFTCWFESEVMPPQAIEEAKHVPSYIEFT